uniref:Probable sulfate transport system permease protein cysT n=1 Tax=Zygnema circumcarinatum TaxID=35869 RepID=CYST_ZYGCR|nr:probable transport protein [Zygnema circumcarinatum]Q32RF7.1 RecName: Full=Probable sulfate transport system permease protein cysT [Zygnema circumcarinatum]AAX45809.1 probable transport protein [Zygnema circumcarinatum]
MILLCVISRTVLLNIRKRDIRFFTYFEFLLIAALHYGILILFLPVTALLLRTKEQSWYTIFQAVTEPVVLSAYKVTFLTAALAAVINAFLGLILAWILVRYRFPGKNFLDAAVDLPFALPTSVGGLTLMTVYSDKGWMGPICSWLGIKIAFSRLGVLIAMMFVSLPFIVRTIQPVLQSMEEETEEAAWCIGASPWTTFWNVLFPPMISPLLTGTALGFSRAIGEYGSIVLVASNIPMKDLVVSVLIFQRLEQYDYKGATAIASVVLLVSFAILLIINYIYLKRKSLTR